jgi:AraC family transcriptional regulator of adaptative response/methylated-DNA-[protein]-cysteine methyltransferase
VIAHADRRPHYQDDETRWRALEQRERAADGVFFCAVRTTGIYCRPSCRSRQPKRVNVEFFDSAEAARHAGYRACKRCKPDQLELSAGS